MHAINNGELYRATSSGPSYVWCALYIHMEEKQGGIFMIIKLIVSLLSGILFLYIMFCVALHTPAFGNCSVEDLPEDINHRWFWVISLYIGDIVCVVFLISIVTIVFYTLIF